MLDQVPWTTIVTRSELASNDCVAAGKLERSSRSHEIIRQWCELSDTARAHNFPSNNEARLCMRYDRLFSKGLGLLEDVLFGLHLWYVPLRGTVCAAGLLHFFFHCVDSASLK